MKVSVIIPVYNTEKYLQQCVANVLNQTYEDLEILLIDDGSTDGSGMLCDKLHENDHRIQVIHKKNGGLSHARNTGIKSSSGEYILFLDSDDYWDDKELIELLIKNTNNGTVDVVNFRYKKYVEKGNQYIQCLNSLENFKYSPNKNIVLENLLNSGLYISSACNKFLRTKFLKDNELYFREGITSEDIDWCARLMLCADTMSYCNVDGYVYRMRDNSISHTLKYKNIHDLKENILECVRVGETINKKTKFYSIYFTFVAYQYGTILFNHNLVGDKRIAEMMQELKHYQWLLDFHSNPKIKMIYWVNKIFGYNNLLRCMKLYTKMRMKREG
ncbi:MAG: glycosyltransferase [Anaerostipes sp.]|nr:glycosyltransferase [Anaerostipes sp.]